MRSLLLGTLLFATSLLAVASFAACTGNVSPGFGEGGVDVEAGATDASEAEDAGTDAPASADAGPGATTGVYYAACLTQLAAGRVDDVFHFYAETSFTAGSVGASGKLSIAITPLKLGATGGAPAAVSKSATTGAASSFVNTAVASTGRFTGDLGSVAIPAAANPISGSDVVIEQAVFDGKHAAPPARFCSRLSGEVTKPVASTLTPANNTCIFIKVTAGAPPPVLTSTDFAGGCPLP